MRTLLKNAEVVNVFTGETVPANVLIAVSYTHLTLPTN